MGKKNCRLCLKSVHDNDFEIMDKVILDILNKLLLQLDLNICEEPVICDTCATNLQKSLNFKLTCISTDEKLLRFNSYKDMNLEPKEISLLPKTNLNAIFEDQKICRFCKKQTIIPCFTTFNVSIENALTSKDMLQMYIPELNLTTTVEPLMCTLCHDGLKSFCKFIMNCLNIEEKIKRYIEIEGTDNKGQIDINNVQQFILKREVKHEANYSDKEEKHLEFGENIIVKTEIKNENFIEINNRDLIIKQEENEIKLEESNCESVHNVTTQPCLEIIEQNNTYTKRQNIGNIQNGLTKKADQKLKHKIMLKCENCPYETTIKRYLESHALVHKSPSEMLMFQCNMCAYITKHKRNLNSHMLTHKSPLEVTLFKCELCPYETKYKKNLRRHMPTHKNSLEKIVPNCETCCYQSKFKKYVTKHMHVYKKDSEVTMYSCSTCTFKSKYKQNFNLHMITLESAAETAMYQCDMCIFKTKYKKNLNAHEITNTQK